MKIILDKSLEAFGVEHVVIGIARNVDPNAELTPAFLQKQKEVEEWALQCNMDEVIQHPFIQGYIELMQKAGRSIKKNPPTIPAFIRNIQHRGSMPHINSIVDIYNVETLKSFLAIGGHDLDKTPKHVAETDYLYRDSQGILAWMGVRDGENYKFDDTTKNAIFIIQGNANTPVEDRIEALHRIEHDLRECMPSLEFEILVVDAQS